jgi:2',3'-cyclic-nucleotide 2'-phosphodiesterase / 3'-nucleotidase / 5'-nucleotidase
MRVRLVGFVGILLLVLSSAASVAARPVEQRVAPRTIALAPIGTYATGVFGEGASEIVAYDPDGARMYVVNAEQSTVDIVSISDPTAPTQVATIDLSPYGGGVNSVDVSRGRVATAVQNQNPQEPGSVVFFDGDGNFQSQVTVGALPDSLQWSANGRYVVVANEGEPSDDYTIDPEGSISIITVRGNLDRVQQRDVQTASFTDFNVGGPRHAELSPDIRIFGPNASVAWDLEPEYVAIAPDSRTAYVTLQENNAVAVVDLRRARVEALVPLGYKDHRQPGNALDASDRDDRVNIQNWPVRGLFQPDAIDTWRARGEVYLITANEGDARDYDGFSEEVRVQDLKLDPRSFPNAAELQADDRLGRLRVTSADGDLDNGGTDYEALYSFGTRSFSIWNSRGELLFDSGDEFEREIAVAYPRYFNANNDDNDSFDSRSDDKGPEPEAVTVGEIDGQQYAFIGLERVGGIMVYNVSNPRAPRLIQYINNRNFDVPADDPAAGDLGPESVTFVSADDSPNGQPLLLVGNEVSGTTTVYAIGNADGAGTLTLLHNNDGESSLLPLQNTVAAGSGFGNAEDVTLDVAGVAAFKTLTEQQIREARAGGNSVVNVYAGDAFLASATLACSLDDPDGPVYDAVAQRQIAYDAHIFGNHEFDYTPDFLGRFIRNFEINGVLSQPFLSANLDFSGEPGFADLLDRSGLITGYSENGQVIARSLLLTDRLTGQRFGIVGATTPQLPTISTPRNVEVTPTLEETAAVVQFEINRLLGRGARKLIFVSHLQDIGNDRELIGLLRHVDVAVAGGGDELLAHPDLAPTEQLLPGEEAPVFGEYPLAVADADGRTVYVVTTAGNYKYLGRIDVEFNSAGEVARVIRPSSYPRRVVPASEAATALGIEDAVTPDARIVETVNAPVSACLETLGETPVARSEVLLDVSRNGVRGAETNAGNLIADAFLYTYDQNAAQLGLPSRDQTPVIAVQNGGGIRQNAGDSLPTGGAPGVLTRLDTLNVLPFANFVTVVQNVSPDDLKTILERSAASLPGQGGQFLQIAGFDVVYSASAPVGSRVLSVVLDDGTAIVQNGAVVAGAPVVSIVTNSFTAGGGDDYPTFAENPDKLQLPAAYEQSWREYLESFPVEDGLPTIGSDDPRYQPGGEGRITIQP